MDEKKVREAIKHLLKKKIALEHKYPRDSNGKIAPNKEYDDVLRSYRIAIEALEKQLPKKVKIKAWCPSYCPSCGYELSESLGDGYYRYPTFLERCPNPDCGQRLDWSE